MSRVSDIFRRIAESDRPEVFVHLRDSESVEADYVAALAAGGPLAGLLLAVKDNVDVAGLPTTAGCPGFAYTPTCDAPAVANLTKAGAVVIGKTNLDQFATGLVGTRSPYGAVRDSRRPGHISGGSSSGSAVAVALGFADIAIGTDTAGSGRVPAGLQGIVGIKPTIGIVSTEGVVPACASYDCVSILAKDLPTAQKAMAAMAGDRSARAWPNDLPLAAPPRAKVAVPNDLPALADNWQAAFADATDRARAAGIEIVSIDLASFLEAARLLYDGALVAERWNAFGEFVSGADAAAGVDATVASIAASGRAVTASELLQDRARVQELRAAAFAELAGCDALMVPTAPMHPTIDEVAADPIGVNSAMGRYTNFCNLFDMSAIAIPVGEVDEGERGVAQFGITLLSKSFHDGVLADLAGRILGAGSSTHSWLEQIAAPVRELAVFGAHLRGQPLDHELSSRGARWAGPIATAANYRLTELDTVPPKPGLLRVAQGGVSIVGEKWVLSASALGDFLAELPTPMLLGSVELQDGSWITGFGCDFEAATAARDISAFGGWVAARKAAVAASQ
ncbi:allophanate hydrolase [Antrihabitans sp. NCIMB 15449]|uniref:Allophanate hydrolase n=1 Tax=Antrihabitans spumae TaxID=3373370 RepID=A0ABW7JV30_9NOCA